MTVSTALLDRLRGIVEEYPSAHPVKISDWHLLCTARELLALIAAAEAGANTPVARPLSEWHEDHGEVMWYRFPIDEAPYVGSPLDLGQTVEIEFRTHNATRVKLYHVGGWPGYHTHWTPLPALPAPPTAEAK